MRVSLVTCEKTLSIVKRICQFRIALENEGSEINLYELVKGLRHHLKNVLV
jgi:hypothetical protein